MSAVKIQPLGDRVLVQAIEVAEQVKGGILIPDSAKENRRRPKLWPWEPGNWRTKATRFRLTSKSAMWF